MKKRNTLIFIIALVLLGVSVFFMSGDLLSPYVTFKEAREVGGKYVQIIGRLDKSMPVVYREGALTFMITDKKNEQKMSVKYQGTKPQNFDQSEQIVLIGKYNSQDEIFFADNILVKCPSKYRRKN